VLLSPVTATSGRWSRPATAINRRPEAEKSEEFFAAQKRVSLTPVGTVFRPFSHVCLPPLRVRFRPVFSMKSEIFRLWRLGPKLAYEAAALTD
jgi:hypothetical protein